MKIYRSKQQKEGGKDDSQDIDDDNVSTTSSTKNNIKLLSDETKITCERGICYHKSYKSRHLDSKAHLKRLKKKQEPHRKIIKINDKNDKLNYIKTTSEKIKILMVKLLCYIQN
jgi:hypothetical protein